LGGILIAKIAGWLFDHYKALGHITTGYMIVFLICGFAYVLAWVIMHFLAPSMKRVEL
jgi:MFS transporter, ACS family, hexuronate transporter